MGFNSILCGNSSIIPAFAAKIVTSISYLKRPDGSEFRYVIKGAENKEKLGDLIDIFISQVESAD
jgi:hypothetical protein